MLTKLRVLVSRGLDDRWEARILEADFMTRARGATLAELFKELYDLIGSHLEGARNLQQEPFSVAPASAEIRKLFEAAQVSLEWLNPPAWADRLPSLEIRCIG